jgi:hypothetical protein
MVGPLPGDADQGAVGGQRPATQRGPQTVDQSEELPGLRGRVVAKAAEVAAIPDLAAVLTGRATANKRRAGSRAGACRR